MREVNLLDVVISVIAACTGAYSIGNAYGIWRVRNGGAFTKAVCAKLLAFGLWSMSILATTLYEWHIGVMVSSVARYAADVDRMILTVPMAVILLFVVPQARSNQEHH